MLGPAGQTAKGGMLSMAIYSSKPLPRGYGTACCARKRVAFAASLFLVILCAGVMLFTVTSIASTASYLPSAPHVDICGDIAEATWTAGGSYHVTCDARLPSGATLTIEPGVEVHFAPEFSLTVAGTLIANGTPDQPITFTSAQEMPDPGDWSGLHFVAGSSDSQLSWCVVEYATTGVRVYAAPGETVGPAFSSCTVRRNSLDGIQIEGEADKCVVGLAQPNITGCTVEDNGACGIYGHGYGDDSEFCSEFAPGTVGGAITHSAIRQNQDAGICLHAQWERRELGDVWIAIEANAISANGGDGVYLYDTKAPSEEAYDLVHPRIENNLIYENSGAGISSDAKHEDVELFVVNNTIASNGGDGVVFHRSAAHVRFANNTVVDNAGYGLVCVGEPVTQAANNDLWVNAGGGYDGCPPGIDDISADPVFVNRAAADFHLAFGSPCIDAGTSEGAPATDIEGIARPQGEAVDIGAHELWYQYIYLPLALRE